MLTNRSPAARATSQNHSGLPGMRVERTGEPLPGKNLNSRQVAAHMRALSNPEGGDPRKLVDRLRQAGYEIVYLDGKDAKSKAFRTAADAKKWARRLRDTTPPQKQSSYRSGGVEIR